MYQNNRPYMATMLITARNKMRGTEVIEYHLNYGGVYADTSKMSREPVINRQNIAAFRKFLATVSFKWENKRYMAQGVSKFDVAQLVRELKIPYVNKKFDTEGLSEYIENSQIFPVWDVVIATGTSSRIPNCFSVPELPAVVRSFQNNGTSDPYIRIGGANNRVLEPSILNAGLWLSEEEKDRILQEKNELMPKDPPYTELAATDYLKRRQCPILVIYPIDLKVSENDTKFEEKSKIKDALGEETPLLAFAIGFPKKESGVTVTYRANLVKLKELSENLEVDDDEEGTEDDDE